MVNVALTGNIAAGKSIVADLFRRWGATLIDADQLAREAQRPGSPVLAEIVLKFGAEVLLPSGELNRARLRSIVLADPAALAALNALVHPAVDRRRQVLVAEARARGDRLVIHDIPLLFEALDPGEFDAVVLVDAPEALRLERLKAGRGLSEAEARAMMAAQLPAASKRARSRFIIENDADLATLEQRTREVWEKLQSKE